MKMTALVLLFVSSLASAATIPRDLALGASDHTSKLLGWACVTMEQTDVALPCQPAMTAREDDADFKAQFFFGNNVSYVREVSDLVSGDGDAESVRRLFSQTHGSEMEADFEAGYRRPTFALAFAPSRIVYYSLIRNEALPQMTLLALQEQTVRMQLASYVGNDTSFGVQFRGVRRKFVAGDFSLADAFAEDGKGLFDTQVQNGLFLEPGLMREWLGVAGRPKVSVMVRNLGFVSEKFDEFPTAPELLMGTSVHPELQYGELELGLAARFNSQTQGLSDPWRVAGIYRLGVTRYSVSAGRSDFAAGFMLLYKNLNGGLAYTTRLIENLRGEQESLRTVYLQAGFDI